jgi:hypothetical protein
MALKHLRVNRLISQTVRAFSPTSALVLVLGFLLASCAGTANPTQAGAEVECVYVKVTGSNLPVKECRSKAEREALAAETREASEDLFRQNQTLDEFGTESVGADSLN